jgi:hypothetical protein
MKAKQMEVQVQDLKEIKMDIAIRISKGKLLSRKEFEIAVQEGYFNDIPYSLYKLTMYTDDERDAQITLNRSLFVEIVDSLKQYFRRESTSYKGNFFGIFPVETKREFLTAEQIELFKQYGFSDEEIGKNISVYDYVKGIVSCQ